jgi:hypothetical protein
MENKEKIRKILFYFDNACRKNSSDNHFIKKTRKFIVDLKPQKIWEKRGVFNRKIGKNVFPDFIILLKNRLIACEVEKMNLKSKYEAYSGLNFFDEIWFFTDIRVNQLHFYYKFENKLEVKKRFFGINDEDKIKEIKLPAKSTVQNDSQRIYDEFFT